VRCSTQHQSSSLAVPSIPITRAVVCEIMRTIGSKPPETGGILLGPIGRSEITAFYFDVTADCTAVTYTPDHDTLRRKMREEWIPAGIDFKGFVHSHPGFDRLSAGDMSYIKRLLAKNPDIEAFAAPIVVSAEYRLRPIVVLRDHPESQHATTLRFVDRDYL
jgi:proteasome lid subunit RPN8/RPN11